MEIALLPVRWTTLVWWDVSEIGDAMLKSVLGAWLLVLCCGATATAGDKPRVVVLKWSSSDLGYDDGDLQRIVKSRISVS